jgi:excisionase family DNA binding protein
MKSSKLISVREFARAKGISYSLARAAVRNNQIPSVRIGRVRRIDEAVVGEFLRRQPEGGDLGDGR